MLFCRRDLRVHAVDLLRAALHLPRALLAGQDQGGLPQEVSRSRRAGKGRGRGRRKQRL